MIAFESMKKDEAKKAQEIWDDYVLSDDKLEGAYCAIGKAMGFKGEHMFSELLALCVQSKAALDREANDPIDQIKEWLHLFESMEKIYKADVPWEHKYEVIFSKNIAGRMDQIVTLSWVDPDGTYQEDVESYYQSACALSVSCREMLKSLEEQKQGE